MSPTRSLVAIGATAALSTPAALAIAADSSPQEPTAPRRGVLHAALDGHGTVRAAMRDDAHHRLVRRYERAARGADHRPSSAAPGWPRARLRREIRHLHRPPPAPAPTPAASTTAEVGAGPTGALAAIAQCESGGDPQAVGGGGTYRGLYQFSYATWAAVGGSGDPAAASVAEQTRRAQILYAQAGPGQWPVCGQ